jgi:hypothetical protein
MTEITYRIDDSVEKTIALPPWAAVPPGDVVADFIGHLLWPGRHVVEILSPRAISGVYEASIHDDGGSTSGPIIRRNVTSMATRDAIVAEYEAGGLVEDIATAYGVTKGTVCGLARKAGLPPRKAWTRRRPAPPPSDDGPAASSAG